MYPLTTTKG